MRSRHRISRDLSALFLASVIAPYAQSQNTGYVGSGVSISFQNSGRYEIGRGVSISFQNAADAAGRGVSVAFGSSVPPAGQMTAHWGVPGGSSRNVSGSASEPVNTATGNYYSTHTDIAAPGKGLSFVFTRSYNSMDPYSGPLGIGWTHSFNIVLTVNPDGSVGIKGRRWRSGNVFAVVGGKLHAFHCRSVRHLEEERRQFIHPHANEPNCFELFLPREAGVHRGSKRKYPDTRI